jgi:hypothetical protein
LESAHKSEEETLKERREEMFTKRAFEKIHREH